MGSLSAPFSSINTCSTPCITSGWLTGYNRGQEGLYSSVSTPLVRNWLLWWTMLALMVICKPLLEALPPSWLYKQSWSEVQVPDKSLQCWPNEFSMTRRFLQWLIQQAIFYFLYRWWGLKKWFHTEKWGAVALCEINGWLDWSHCQTPDVLAFV